MENSSPTTLMFGGIMLASISLKLQKDYTYIFYIAVITGLVLFVAGIIKYIKQRKDFM